MFWKLHLRTYLRPTCWPLTFRLAVIYTLVAFGLLAFSTLFLYWIFANRLQLDSEHFLQNKILILQKMLPKQGASFDISASLHDEVILEPPVDHFFSRVVDQDGRVLIETPGMSKLIPLFLFKHLIPQGKSTFKTKQPNHSSHKRYYLLMNAPADLSLPSGNNQRFIQMVLDVTSQHKIIEDIRETLIAILLLGIVVCAVVSLFVTYRSLKPLREMTASVQRITVTHLKERLNPLLWPSELSTLAVAFNRMLDRIEEGVARLSQFSADLAHELRTPINNLMGETEVALSRPRTLEEYQEILESGLGEFHRLSQMVENLLFLARAENPQKTIIRSWIDLSPLLRDLIDFYEPAAEEKGVALIYEGNQSIKADPTLLRQAISNLISNALQYTPTGGKILVFSRMNADQSVQIHVKDTGNGIAAEHASRIFDRFYRVEKDRSCHTGGSGLGLAIVKSIMDLHQGAININSQVDVGTEVVLLFAPC